MSSNSPRVIVFGPSGSVGSIAAKTARENGAKVYLAMRDPSKNVPGLSMPEESGSGYQRIQADLTSAQSVRDAVIESQATSAFLYLAHGTPDHMKGTLEALRAAGINFVVFLSSYTIKCDTAKVPREDMIAWPHAQVEVQLEAIFGPGNYVAVRPGGFATNTLSWKAQIHDGDLKLLSPGAQFDYVTPVDIGMVCGTILATGQQRQKEKIVYVFGPQMHRQEEAAFIVARALQKTIKISSLTIDENVAAMENQGAPTNLAHYVTSMIAGMRDTDGGTLERPEFRPGQNATMRYLGRNATGFESWVQANSHMYMA